MTAIFHIISLGPGHSEQITIQALRSLQDCDVIFVPTRSQELTWKGSVAYKILKQVQETHSDWFKSSDAFGFMKNWEEKFKPIYTPMSYDADAWKSQVEEIIDACNKYSNVGFVTLGDAALFSSGYYLLNIIKEKHPEIYNNTVVIPGITSISYASSKVKRPLCLGNSSLEIVPMHTEEVKSTKVYMRLHKGDDVSNLGGNELYYFENLGLDNEAYGEGTPGIIENYLTVIIDFANQNAPSPKTKEKIQ